MILFWYTHWFWITILIVCTSAVRALEKQTNPHQYTTSNVTSELNKTIATKVETVSNATKIQAITETTISLGIIVNSSVSLNLSLENATNSVIDTNATSEDNETLATLETTFNDSIALSDRAASIANVSDADAQEHRLSAAGITGITLGCVVLVAMLCGASYIWYRSRGFNRPQVLTDRSSNLDSSGYIDDTSVRDNSEEMYSLDNDSFLNSLEAMTIQNYWTDTVKHTKL